MHLVYRALSMFPLLMLPPALFFFQCACVRRMRFSRDELSCTRCPSNLLPPFCRPGFVVDALLFSASSLSSFLSFSHTLFINLQVRTRKRRPIRAFRKSDPFCLQKHAARVRQIQRRLVPPKATGSYLPFIPLRGPFRVHDESIAFRSQQASLSTSCALQASLYLSILVFSRLLFFQ